MVFVADARAPSAARRHARLTCSGVTSERLCDDVALAVSELVTNAVSHGLGGEVGLVLRVTPQQVFAAVRDDGGGFTRVSSVLDPSAEGGRGLSIVEDVSVRWGVQDLAGAGKSVWCVIGTSTS